MNDNVYGFCVVVPMKCSIVIQIVQIIIDLQFILYRILARNTHSHRTIQLVLLVAGSGFLTHNLDSLQTTFNSEFSHNIAY